MSDNKINTNVCACCGLDWMDRKSTTHNTGAKSDPMLIAVRIKITKNKDAKIKVMFCDLHFDKLGSYTRYLDNELEIKNLITNRWRRGRSLGVAA